MTGQPSGAMVALLPTVADADRLAVPGGEPADQLHVTLAYLGDAASLDPAAQQDLIDALTTAVNGMPTVDADVFSLAAFNPGGADPCLVLGLSGDWLDAVHHFVTEAIPDLPIDQHAPWQPHITVEYTDDLTGLAKLADRIGPVTFDRIRVAVGGDTLDIPLIPGGPQGMPELVDGADNPDPGLWLDEAAGDGAAGSGTNLKRWWLAGAGLKKWAFSAHPWTALFHHLRKHMDPQRAKLVTSRWYIDHFGHTPNQKRPGMAESALVEVAIAETGHFTTA